MCSGHLPCVLLFTACCFLFPSSALCRIGDSIKKEGKMEAHSFFESLDKEFTNIDRIEDEVFVYKGADVLVQSTWELPIIIQWPGSTIRFEFSTTQGDHRSYYPASSHLLLLSFFVFSLSSPAGCQHLRLSAPTFSISLLVSIVVNRVTTVFPYIILIDLPAESLLHTRAVSSELFLVAIIWGYRSVTRLIQMISENTAVILIR